MALDTPGLGTGATLNTNIATILGDIAPPSVKKEMVPKQEFLVQQILERQRLTGAPQIQRLTKAQH